MKAIETKWRGYSFRSRLEARWAVFFDALGLEWDYESEGFQLPGGYRYLPDFKVKYPGTKRDDPWEWFECKPDLSLIPATEWPKLAAFSAQMPQGLVLLDGPPSLRTYLRVTDLLDGALVPSRERMQAALNFKRAGTVLWCEKERLWGDEHDNVFIWGPVDCPIGDSALAHLTAAVERARGARFEHGAKP
jgi:hypothetical protein